MTGAGNIRESEKDEEPNTRDKGAEMTEQYLQEAEQQHQELSVVAGTGPTFKEPNRGAEEEATLTGRFHNSDSDEDTFGIQGATKDDGEALETLGDIFSISEDADYSLEGPKDTSPKDEDDKLKPPGIKYAVSFKQPDGEIEDTSLEHPKSKPKTGFREPDKHDEDESTQHPKSKTKITFKEPNIGKKDDSTQHTK
jgi:hypothetical protein